MSLLHLRDASTKDININNRQPQQHQRNDRQQQQHEERRRRRLASPTINKASHDHQWIYHQCFNKYITHLMTADAENQTTYATPTATDDARHHCLASAAQLHSQRQGYICNDQFTLLPPHQKRSVVDTHCPDAVAYCSYHRSFCRLRDVWCLDHESLDGMPAALLRLRTRHVYNPNSLWVTMNDCEILAGVRNIRYWSRFFWERVWELAGTIDWCYNNPIANYNKYWDNNNCNKMISWKGQAAKIEEHNKNFHSFFLELR